VSPDIRELSHLQHVLRGNGYGVHQLLWDLFPGEKERPFLFREEIAKEQLPLHKGARGEPIYYLVSHHEPKAGNPLFIVDSKPYAPRIAIGERLSFKLRANPTVARKRIGKKNSVRHDVVMDAQHRYLRELAHLAGVQETGKKADLKDRIFSSLIMSKNSDITAKLEETLKTSERYRGFLEQKYKPENLIHLALNAASDLALEAWLTDKGEKNGFIVTRDEEKERLKFQAEGYRWHALPQKGKSAGFSSVDFEGEIEVTDSERFGNALITGIGPAKGFGCGLMLVRRIG